MADGFISYFNDVPGRKEFYYIPTQEEFDRLRWDDDRGRFDGPGVYYIDESTNHCGYLEYTIYKMNDDDLESLLDFCDQVKAIRGAQNADKV